MESQAQCTGSDFITRERRDYLIRNRDVLECDHGWQNRRNLPPFSARPPCPDGDLCKDCEYAIHEMIWPLQEYEMEDGDDPDFKTRGCAGWVDRMMATEHCPFCAFLVKIFFDSCPGFPRSEVVCEKNRRRFCCWLNGPHLLNVTASQPRPDQMVWDCSVKYQEVIDFVPEPGTYSPYVEEVGPGFRLDISASDLAIQLYGKLGTEAAILSLSRVVSNLWNASLFREALQVCQRRHGAECDASRPVLSGQEAPPSPTLDPKGPEIRVIDVQNMCIVPLPPKGRYVALSYCWTKRTYTTLVRANAITLAKQAALRAHSLAPVVRDAITVVQELGETYLWVDSLCIVQDDTDDKSCQIARMDKTYRMALLTIVAAASSSAHIDVGLPGVGGLHQRQSLGTVNVRGLQLQQKPPNLREGLRRTTWDMRAWTLQEFLLSRRLLIFLPEQAYFFCEQAVFAEDFVDHVCLACKQIDVHSLTPCCNLTISETNGDGKCLDGPRNYHHTYESLVETYTRRQMTFSSDAINAARGLLNLLHHEHGVSFLCGLPVPHLLGHFATWCSTGTSQRRVSPKPECAIPSWSWAGWEGAALYPDSSDPETGIDRLFLVADCEDAFSRHGIEIELYSEVEEWVITLPSKHGQQHLYPEAMDASKLMSIDSCLLTFRTEVARFEIAKQTYGRAASSELVGFNGCMCYPVMFENTPAGAVIFDDARERVSMHGFLALSTAKHHWKMWYPIVPTDPNHWDNFLYYLDEEHTAQSRPPFDTSKFDVMGRIVNVLLFKYEETIAFRIGVGQIHLDAWNAAQPTIENITLG